MIKHPTLRSLSSLYCALLLAGCASTTSVPQVQTQAVAAKTTMPPTATPASSLPGPPQTTPLGSLPPGMASATPVAAPTAPTDATGADRAILFPGTGNFVKGKPRPAPRVAGGGAVQLNYESADLREVAANILGTILKENYSVHPAVQGTVTLRTSEPIAPDALLPTLETLLRQYGATLVREEGLIKVMPVAFAIRGSAAAQLGSASMPLPRGLSVQVVPLKWVSARDMWKLLEPIVTDPSVIRVDDVRNFVILAGTENELRHLLDSIELFDVDYLAGMSVGLFTLRSADAKTVAQEISLLFGDIQQGPLAGVVRIIAVERLNGLLVVTTQPEYLEKARAWIDRLDKAGTGAGGKRLHVYHMQYSKAENVAKLLNDIFGRVQPRPAGASSSGPSVVGVAATVQSSPLQLNMARELSQRSGMPATPTPPGATAARSASAASSASNAGLLQDVQVIADKENNAIMILALPEDYEVIEAAIKKLDVIQRQVLVEVTLAEFTLTDELQFGIDWFLNSREGSRYVGRLGSMTSDSVTIAPPTVGNVSAGRGLTLVRTLSGGQVNAILNLIATDSRGKIIATPSTMVADNHPATIKVGTRVPVKSQSQSGATTGTLIESIQYIETGVLLEVTPQINSGSRVALEINVELSQARVNRSSNIDSPEVSNRSAKSLVTVGSGETVVLAGLIRQESSDDSSGLPGLSKIPVIGGLFGSQSRTGARTELVVLITPKVINDARQARDITEELLRKVPSLKKLLAKPTPEVAATPEASAAPEPQQ